MSEVLRAKGNPTKGFFINMLTRDIELNDAILDLLDNCLDGVVRIRQHEGVSRDSGDYYKGYKASITISKDRFVIEDNCGGIPLDIARERAFRMGRDETSPKDEVATVGIYGIGMKRAIFKLGKSSVVTSVTKENAFQVIIPNDWESQDEWDFSIQMIDTDHNQYGTKIEVSDLNESIRKQWSEQDHLDNFVSVLISHIKKSYSLIIERGFIVTVNGIVVEGDPVSFIWSDDANGIKPYIFKNEVGGVSIKVVVGFYAPPPTIDESDSIAEGSPRRSSLDAGWTVICNDRVVLYNNKDHLTGWGENGVPKYHTQFIGIRGVVEFTSNDPEKLPMTTTKIGVDLASPLYADVKRRMCDGIKLFTGFTNAWKGTANAETQYFKRAKKKTIDDLVKDDNTIKFFSTQDGGKQSKPSLPKPEKYTADTIWVRFAVRDSECRVVSQYLFEEDRPSSEVGIECFNRVLAEAQIEE